MGRFRASKAAFRLLQVTVVGLVLLTAAGFAGRGPFASVKHSSNSSSAATHDQSSTTRPNGPTSSTIPALELRSYEKGQCVTWDQTPSVARQDTSVVSCARPHLVEIAGSIKVSGESERYPTEAQWKRVFAGQCLPLVQKLVGAPLDPAGRFTTGGIRPLSDAWSEGNRTVWCGASSTADEPGTAYRFAAFTGKVEGASQTHLDAVGTCLTATAVVTCAKPHLAEITGYVDVPGSTVLPAGDDNAAWNRLVGSQCTQQARAYVARALGRGEVGAWLPILAPSWNAGRRTVECTTTHFDADGHPVTRLGSARG